MEIFNKDVSVLGDLTISPSNAIGDFLTIDVSGVVRYRTPSEVLNDIGSSSPLTATGDMYVYSTSNGNDRLPVGNNGQLLTADSTEDTGLTWKDAEWLGEAPNDGQEWVRKNKGWVLNTGGASVGESNTASSQGTGQSLYYQKIGSDLQFYSIKSENNILGISLNGATNDIELTVNQTAITINESQISDLGSYLTAGDNISLLTNDSGYITDYTVTEGDVTQHEDAITITESQISDLTYVTNNNQLINGAGYITSFTNTQLTAEQVEDIMGAAWISGTNTTFVYDDINGTLKINSTDTDTTYTNLSEFTNDVGYITSFTNTQLSDEEVQDIVGAFISGSGATSVAYNDTLNTIVVSSTDTDTQRTDEEIMDVIATVLESSGATTIVYDDAGDTITISSTDTMADGSETIINSGANVTVTGSGTSGDPYSIASSFTNTDNYVDSAAFSTANGNLTIGRTGALADIIVNLDGRYLTSQSDSQTLSWVPTTGALSISSGNSVNLDGRYLTSFTETDPIFTASQAFNITSVDVVNLGNLSGTNSGDQTSIVGISGTKAQFNTELTDGNFLFVGDITDTNNYISGASFNTSTGDLTITREGLSDIVENFDGRYLTVETDSQNLTWTDDGNLLSISGGNSVNITGFADTVHTHVISDITDFTDNSTNWDAAFGWGDHSGLYMSIDQQLAETFSINSGEFLTGYNSVNGQFSSSVVSYQDLDDVPNTFDPSAHTHVIADITDFTDNSANWNTAFSWGNHSSAGYLTSVAFNDLTNKISGTGNYSTNGYLISGRGSGGVALTTNDGYGNANVTFNHLNGIPEQNGNSARIEVNTDSTSDAHFSFELQSNVSGSTITTLTQYLKIDTNGIDVNGTVNSNSFITDGGTASQFVKGDGTLDSNTYLTSFDITTQTDPKYLRADVDDTFESRITGDSGAELRLENSTDVSLSSTGHAFQIGLNSGANIAIGINEILARNNGATTRLNFNTNGGEVFLGGELLVSNIPQATIDTNKFLVDDGNTIKYRTGAQLASDIGAITSIDDYLRSDVTDIKTSGTLTFNDSIRLDFGTSNDVRTQYTGTNLVQNHVSGDYIIQDNGVDRFIFERTTGNVTASAFVTSGGVSSQFVKGDGSLDSSTYLTSYTETDPIFVAHTTFDIGTGTGLLQNDGAGNWSYDNSTYLTSFDITTQTDPKYLRSDVADVKTSGTLTFNDSVRLDYGTGNDVRVQYSGTNLVQNHIAGDYIIQDNGFDRFTFGRTTGNFTATNNIIANNKIGIGTTSLASVLNIYENSGNTGTTAGLTIEQDGSGDAVLQFLLTGTARWQMGIDNSDGKKFKIDNGSPMSVGSNMELDSSGNVVWAGTSTSTNFILSSDRRLKDGIKDFDHEQHIKMDVKTYELKSEPGVKRTGVIAQELEKDHPEFVRTDSEGMKSVAYTDLLIAKIAELEARLEKAGL
tara:strand:+ start:1791 stop:6110 length:4320 start_codon:yes stop_codon:yes gene_type:complete